MWSGFKTEIGPTGILLIKLRSRTQYQFAIVIRPTCAYYPSMLDFLADKKASLCGGSHLRRREFLQVGALGAIGLSLPQLLAAKAAGAVSKPKEDRSCIMIFNLGGPSHVDLWDMKPDAAREVRGPFKPIRTKSPDIDISEILPLHAKIADKFSLVRSVHHGGAAVHDAGWQILQTGRRFTGGIQTPHAGAVVSYLRGRKTDLPPFVVLPELMVDYYYWLCILLMQPPHRDLN